MNIEHLSADNKKLLCFTAAVLAAAITLFLPLDIVPFEHQILTVVVFMLVLFMTEAVPLAVAGLMGCLAFWVFCGQPLTRVFSGFTDSTPWFILGALMIGAAAMKAEIPNRLAFSVIRRVGASYGAILAGLILLNFVLTIVIPSGTARVVVLCTIAVGLVRGYNLDIQGNIARGMILVLTYTATIFDKTIIAGAASILSRGIIENFSGEYVSWGKWFLAYAPADIVTIVCCWYIAMKLFPAEATFKGGLENNTYVQEQVTSFKPLTGEQKRVIALLLVATVLWATDFLHGINPAMTGIAVGLACFIPGLGILDSKDFNKLNFPIVIFVGATLCMGNMLVDTAVLTKIGDVFFRWLQPLVGHDHLLAAGMYGLANIFHIFLGNEPALLSATLPLVMDFSVRNGLHPETMGMIWTFAAGGKLFVYQSGVLAVGYAFGAFSSRDLLKLGIAVIIVEGINISLITLPYWSLLGITMH